LRQYAESGRTQIPTINGSKPVNEHFSGRFRQHDSQFRIFSSAASSKAARAVSGGEEARVSGGEHRPAA